MPSNDMLGNPLANAKPLPKAPRAEHPTAEPARRATDAATPTPTNRVGPNRVRKSFYLPADIANEFSEAANRIHHGSGGRISKAEAAGTIIRLGLENLPQVYQHLHVSQP